MSPVPSAASKPIMTSGAGRTRPAVELPTLLLLIVAYGGWLAVTSRFAHWPLWMACSSSLLRALLDPLLATLASLVTG